MMTQRCPLSLSPHDTPKDNNPANILTQSRPSMVLMVPPGLGVGEVGEMGAYTTRQQQHSSNTVRAADRKAHGTGTWRRRRHDTQTNRLTRSWGGTRTHAHMCRHHRHPCAALAPEIGRAHV